MPGIGLLCPYYRGKIGYLRLKEPTQELSVHDFAAVCLGEGFDRSYMRSHLSRARYNRARLLRVHRPVGTSEPNLATSSAGSVAGVNGVQIGPGATAFTRIPFSTRACDNERAKLTMAPLVEAQSNKWGLLPHISRDQEASPSMLFDQRSVSSASLCSSK